MTKQEAQHTYSTISGDAAPLRRAPPHFGTNVFLHRDGRTAISAIYDHLGQQFAWRVAGEEIPVSAPR